MILNTGARTDTVQHFTPWLLKRCIESRDLGAYDTCLNGCRYCYANKSPQKARDNYKLHDPDSPLILGHLSEDDTLAEGNQKSFLKSAGRQSSLFDG